MIAGALRPHAGRQDACSNIEVRSTAPFVTRWGWNDLFRGFDQLFREFDREPPITSFGYTPSRLVEEEDRFVLNLEAPGLTENDVRVDLNAGVLTVTAERPVDVPEGYTPRAAENAPRLDSRRASCSATESTRRKTTAEMKDGVFDDQHREIRQASRKKTIAVKAKALDEKKEFRNVMDRHREEEGYGARPGRIRAHHQHPHRRVRRERHGVSARGGPARRRARSGADVTLDEDRLVLQSDGGAR